MADRTVAVRLDLRIGPFQRATADAAKAVRDFTGKSEKELDRLGAGMQRLGTRMTIGLTAPLALLAKQAVETAGSAQEAMNRLGVVFGENADEVEAWAQDSARAMGLARHEAIGTASNFANMFTEMGLGVDAARRMSMSVVELAADVGSFRDVDPTEMLEKMRAGVVGEYEPLRQLGIVLTDANVRLEAVRMGLADTADEVTTAGLVQGRYSLILRATSKDQGDYARTAESAVNAQRTASAAYRDAMAELGDNLLPIVAKGALLVTDLAEAFAKLPEGAQSAILGFGGLLAVAGPLLIGLGSVVRNLKEIQALGPRAASALRFGGVALGAYAVVEAFDAVNSELQKMRSGATNVAEVELALARLSETGEVSGEMAERFGDELGTLADAFERVQQGDSTSPGNPVVGWLQTLVGMDLGSAKEKVEALDEALVSIATQDPSKAAAAFDEIAAQLAEQGVELDVVREGLPAYTDLLARNEAQQILTGDAAGEAGEEIAGLGADADEAKDAVDRYTEALSSLADGELGVQAATDSLASDIISLGQAVADAKEEGDAFATSLDATTERGLANRAAIRDMAQGALDLAVALREQGVAEADIASVMGAYRTELSNVLAQMGFNVAKVDEYLSVLGLVPSSVNTVITADNSQALAAIAMVRAAAFDLASSLAGLFGFNLTGGDAARAQADALSGVAGMSGGFDYGAGRTSGGGGGSSEKSPEEKYQEERARNIREVELEKATLQERVRILDERIAAEREYSDEWMRLREERARAIEEIEEAEREHAERTAEYLNAVHEQMLDMHRERYSQQSESSEDFIAVLRTEHERLVEIHGYWSQEAARIRDEIRGILDDQARAMEDVAEAYDRAMGEAKKAVEDAMGHLNGLLDDERDIRRRLADSRQEHEERMAEIGRKFVEDQQGALDDRKRQLNESLDIEERFVAGWANTPAALARNARAQIEAFEEWSDRLAEARARGLSDDVIDMLGLAEGPEALAQLRMFASATDAEIAEMNAAIAARAEWVNGQVNKEQSDAYSTLSETLLGLAERHHAEVEALTEEFLAEQRDLKDELAAVGADQGRSYGDAIAEGLRSSIPAIREAAEAAQRAMRDADRAGGGSGGGSGGGGYEVVNGRPPGGGYTSDHGTVIIGKKKYVWHGGVASVPGSPGTEVDARLLAGERVLSVPDNRALVAAVQGMGSAQVTVAPSFTVELYDMAGRRLSESDVRVIVRDERGKAVSAASRAGSR